VSPDRFEHIADRAAREAIVAWRRQIVDLRRIVLA
jgi:hypothetical protein